MKQFNARLLKKCFYATEYFKKTKKILTQQKLFAASIIQFKTFNQSPIMVCGTEEIINILEKSIPKKQFELLKIYYVNDGTIVQPNTCILSIHGPYAYFCEFENVIDGILARRCSVATNCHKILTLIESSQLIFMADRSDDYQLHPFDGYAAYVAGVRNFSNQSHIALLKKQKDTKIVGTMPHALIQQFNGDIEAVLHAYRKYFSHPYNMLVDFENDVIKTLSTLQPHFKKIDGIRIDTSSNMIDESLKSYTMQNECYGVNEHLIKIVRNYLDKNNGQHIKIIASSALNYKKIQTLLNSQTPIDFYGIGSSLIEVNLHFTADVVFLDNKPFAKVGRCYLSEDHLKLYVSK